MKLIVTGVGPGSPDLITIRALNIILAADLVIIPRAEEDSISMVEQVIIGHLKNAKTTPLVFPMVDDVNKRDNFLREQLERLYPVWKNAEVIVLPVIGDATLYASGAYLYKAWSKIVPGLKLELVSGISAYSLAAASSGSFLAMGKDIFVVISGTSSPERIQKALIAADSAAIYKPVALKDNLRLILNTTGSWSKIIRIDRAGLSGEKIIEGEEALNHSKEYWSILLLWR